MDLQSILKDCKIIRVKNAVAAGSTDSVCTTVDMQGFDGVCFIASIGTLTATQVTSLKAAQGSDSGGAGAVDITGAATAAMGDGDSNKTLVLDVRRPTSRYVTATVKRATANAVIDSVIAILYRGATRPVTVDSSVSQSAGVTAN